MLDKERTEERKDKAEKDEMKNNDRKGLREMKMKVRPKGLKKERRKENERTKYVLQERKNKEKQRRKGRKKRWTNR